jgi:hypothetical protein
MEKMAMGEKGGWERLTGRGGLWYTIISITYYEN